MRTRWFQVQVYKSSCINRWRRELVNQIYNLQEATKNYLKYDMLFGTVLEYETLIIINWEQICITCNKSLYDTSWCIFNTFVIVDLTKYINIMTWNAQAHAETWLTLFVVRVCIYMCYGNLSKKCIHRTLDF